MTIDTKQLENILNQVFTDLVKDDPSWLKIFPRSPSYRYFYRKGKKDRYFWTIKPVNHNNKRRYVSGIYRFLKTRNVLKATNLKYHARRKDAKARALKLYLATQG